MPIGSPQGLAKESDILRRELSRWHSLFSALLRGFPNLFIVSGPQGGGGQFNFIRVIDAHTDYVTWMMKTMRERGAGIVDVYAEPEETYAAHCREADIRTRPLRDCISYYNDEGNAEPGSLAYYGGPEKWHELRNAAQESLDAFIFEPAPMDS